MSALVHALRKRGYGWAPLEREVKGHGLVAAKRAGKLVHVSGQVPFRDGKVVTGKVGKGGLTVEEAAVAAELCALRCLYAAGSVVQPEQIKSIVNMKVLVNVAPGFNQMSAVADGASDFLVAVLGKEDGMPSRIASGAASLPLDASVEIDMVIEVV